jgi:hypothetical protein
LAVPRSLLAALHGMAQSLASYARQGPKGLAGRFMHARQGLVPWPLHIFFFFFFSFLLPFPFIVCLDGLLN